MAVKGPYAYQTWNWRDVMSRSSVSTQYPKLAREPQELNYRIFIVLTI